VAGVAVAELLARARYWGLKVATAESCTGGMVAAALTEVAGSSDVFERGFVTYSNEAKMELLGVKAEALEAQDRRAGRIGAQARGPGLFRPGAQGPGDAGRDGGVRRARPGQGARGLDAARAGVAGRGDGVAQIL
jgi:nicotinamide-nucleotide amidase